MTDIYINTSQSGDSNFSFAKVNTYKDENIFYEAKTKDITEVGGTFNDLTNTFNVPATETNNAIFRNWFELGIQNPFNPNLLVDAYIETNTIPFSFGDIQLEDVQWKDGKPSSYSITFYAKLTSLKDTFGEDTLKNLDLSAYDYSYTQQNIIDRFETDDVFYPLMLHTDRNITYGISGGINTSTGIILGSEIYPAIKQSILLDAIEEKYNIVFSNEFKNSEAINKLSLLMNDKRSESWSPANTYYSGTTVGNNGSVVINNDSFKTSIDLTNGQVNTSQNYQIGVLIRYVGSSDVPFKMRLINNNNEQDVIEMVEANGGSYNPFVFLGISNSIVTGDVIHNLDYRVEVFSDVENEISFSDIRVVIRYEQTPLVTPISEILINQSLNVTATFSNDVLIQNYIPKIKIKTFVDNLIDMFNLILIPTAANTFELITLDEYYEKGNLVNITPYVDDENKIDKRRKIPTLVKYRYEDLDTVRELEYRERPVRNSLGFGSLDSDYTNVVGNGDTEEINIDFKLPIITQIANTGNTINTTSIFVGLMQTVELEIEKPQGVIFYHNSEIDCLPFKFAIDVDTNSVNITKYPLVSVSNGLSVEDITNSLMFGVEQDGVNGLFIEKSLTEVYYKKRLDNLYNLNNREVEVDANIPDEILQKIKLNSTIIYKNDLYNINSYKINLTNNKIEFSLFPTFFSSNKILS